MPLLSFLSDEDLMKSIHILYQSYLKCQQQMSLNKFYSNKVDPIKFYFDMTFNSIPIENYINLEIIRQNDKTISNAIGTFHQSLLGSLKGFINLNTGNGCDLANHNNTIFAEIKNKHNTMNSSSAESTFQKLIKFAEMYPESTCYLVEIIAKKSQNILWQGSFNGTYYSHPRIRRISADKFYALATGEQNAFKQLCDILPKAVHQYLQKYANHSINKQDQSTLYNKIKQRADNNNLDILSQIMKDNFNDYFGFI